MSRDLFLRILVLTVEPAGSNPCTGRIGVETDEDVLPLRACSSRLTALQGRCHMFLALATPGGDAEDTQTQMVSSVFSSAL